ncbi:MAG: polysaccharide deacetylase family protein [Planctomycetales bacterium]|nr:polysaccharide deacetylase family protein [Planctomycetales bacterium]
MSGIIGHTMYAILGCKAFEAKRLPSALLILALCATLTAEISANEDAAARSAAILAFTEEAASQIDAAHQHGLLEISPVNLPSESIGDCNHFGWPIATMTGNTIVVMHRRIPGHKADGAGEPDPSMSYGVVLRSDDGGVTWSRPYDLRDCMRAEDRVRGGIVPLSHRAKFDKANKSPLGYKVHLHSIGTTSDGAVVAINNHGVFRSEDAGQTWKHFSTALRDDHFPYQIINLGPRILDDPQHGLIAFGNWFGEVDSYHELSNRLVALSSKDGGATWAVEEHDVGFPQYEPAAILHDGRYLFVTRNQTEVRSHRQMDSAPGKPPVVIDTNLEDPRLVDTVDFSFNPVTHRFEIVRSERHHMELWLWSMDPAEWTTGKWRRECRLVARKGKFYSTADGFHPAGAVIDHQRGVQHIFIYAGHPNGPAGVFRVTRTLNTPALKEAMSDERANSATPRTLDRGGVLLTFDDRNFDDWVKAIPLFDEFKVKATFFISGEIDQEAHDAIRQLTAHGHAIGSHSVNHLKAVEYCQQRSTAEFLRLEIQPQLEAFQRIGVTPVAFAYPMSRNDAVTDDALLKVFRHVRTGRNIAAGERLSEVDAYFVPANEMKKHGCLYAKGIDHAPTRADRTFEQLDTALSRAAKNQEIIVLYAHRISETGIRNYVTPDALRRIIGMAKSLGLEFYTFDQLP